MLRERDRPVGDRGARRLIAAEHQHLEEVPELGGRQAVAADLGVHQVAHDVVGGVLQTLVAELGPVLVQPPSCGAAEGEQAQRRRVAVGVRRQRLRLGGALDQVVRQLHHVVGVFGRHAQDRDDHPDRQRRRHQFHPLAAAPLDHHIEQLVGNGTRALGVPAHLAGCERLGHHPAQPRVRRWVVLEDRSAGLQCVGLEVPQVDVPDGRREALRMARHLAHVGVARHRPEAPVRMRLSLVAVPVQTRPCAKLAEVVPGNAVPVAAGVDDVDVSEPLARRRSTGHDVVPANEVSGGTAEW